MINLENWQDFMPFGINGIFVGAATVFMPILALTQLQRPLKSKNRKRFTNWNYWFFSYLYILYVAVSLVLTGIAHYSSLDNAEPLARTSRKW